MRHGAGLRRMREEEVDGEGTWAVSYGDMVTLLLTFFILFFSINPNAKETSGGEQEKPNPLSISLMGSLRQFANGSATPENDPQGKNQNTGLKTDKDFISKTQASLLMSGQKIIIDFPEVSFFSSGKIKLTKSGKKALLSFITAYQPYMGQYNLVIQAFADTKKVKNYKYLKFSDNLELSALRGVSTLRFLQEKGIPLNNMKVAGYGENEVTKNRLGALPKNKSDPKYLRGLARRVVLVIEPLELPI